jgi:hypothetical protein
MNAADVLNAARAAGLCLAVDGDELVLESSGAPPSAVLDLIRAHKPEIIAAITATKVASAASADYVADWRDWYEERAAIRQFDGGYTRDEAECLAWSEAEDRWHRARGDRVPCDLCAGCRRPIGSAEALDLIDGNRVHFGELDCLIRHGDRLRAVAARALMALGLRPPDGLRRRWISIG